MTTPSVRVKNVSTKGGLLTVWLDDGRILSLPLSWYPSLAESRASERSLWRRHGGGEGIHWPALDYDLDVEGLLLGAKEMPTILAYTRRFRAHKKLGRKAGPVFDPVTGLNRLLFGTPASIKRRSRPTSASISAR
jgi:hypothetical protein